MDVTFRRFLCCRGHLQIWTGWWWDEFLHGWNESAYFCTQLYAPKSWWSMRGTMKELCQICVLLVEIAFWAMAVGSTSSELVPAKWTYVLVGLCNLLWHWRGPTNMHSCFNLPPAAESDASPSHTNLSVNASTSLSSKCTVWCAAVPKTSAVGGSQINQTFAAIHKIDPFHSCTLAAFTKKSTLLYGRWNRPWKILPQRLFFSLKALVPQGRCMGVGNWRIPLVYEGHSYFNHFLQIAIWLNLLDAMFIALIIDGKYDAPLRTMCSLLPLVESLAIAIGQNQVRLGPTAAATLFCHRWDGHSSD